MKHITWYQLWKKIGKQPLRLTQHKRVTVKIQEKEYPLKIVYTDNGNDWYLEIIE